MEFWASAIVRCAGWHRDCTPTYTASFTIPKTRKPFFAAAAVGLCGARVSFSPRVRSEDSVVAGNGARRIRFGPLSLSVCVCESCAILWRIDGLVKVKRGYYNFRLCLRRSITAVCCAWKSFETIPDQPKSCLLVRTYWENPSTRR